MSRLPHLRLENTQEAIRYTYAKGVGPVLFRLPVRDPSRHSEKLRAELESAQTQAQQHRHQEGTLRPEVLERKPEGFVLTFESEMGYDLKLESFDRKRQGIELRSVSERNGVLQAQVFVPDGRIVEFLRLLDEYSVPSKGNRRNQPFIDSIRTVRLAVVEDFWEDTRDFPPSIEKIWWEIWLCSRRPKAVEVFAKFAALVAPIGIRLKERYVTFPEHVVLLAYASAQQLAESIDVLAMISELRKAKELAAPYLDLKAGTQREFVNDVLANLIGPPQNAPSVCILDGGIDRDHPLLAPALAPDGMYAVELDWGTADDDLRKHGTGMAGIALYGCLTSVFAGDKIHLRHMLESVKVLPPPPKVNEPDSYGAVTQIAAARVMIRHPERNRVYCMAITSDDSDHGLPSSWSGAVDETCAGVLDDAPKLMFISAGNVAEEFYGQDYIYHDWNCNRAGVEDPGQAWNSLTVGAFTEKVMIQDPTYMGYEPVAAAGDLCPTSRTSLSWGEDSYSGWPIKPELVMEGGNYAERGGERTDVEDLSLLTTRLYPTGRLVDVTRDTSPATAAAARMAAILWSHYPHLRPETIRGLMVHSARWTSAMTKRFPGDKKKMIQRCLRCYGYGVPDLDRAIYSAENVPTLIFEGQLRPFHKDKGEVKTHEMHVHALPWPKDVLEALGAAAVTMRVTLSYFVEPSPGKVGWGKNHRYASHGLRFDVIRPYEDIDAFRARISRAEWQDPKVRPKAIQETRNWTVGADGRTHGSLHSDWWQGTAADLAQCGYVVVYPVTGWWRERAHLGRFNQPAPYSLIVSIETPVVDIDLYHAITAVSEVSTELFV